MRKRTLGYLVAILLAVSVVSYYVAPQFRMRLSWYYPAGELDMANLLVTCAAQTPVFRRIGMDFGVPADKPHLSRLEVFLACKVRDHLAGQGVFEQTTIFAQNVALEDLVEKAGWCFSSKDLPPEMIAPCRDAYFRSIDWLLSQGIDINGGELGTVLNATVLVVDEDMFAFLLSRGADPHFRPPASKVYATADSRLKEMVDTVPRSAVDLLEIYLARLDENEFPEEVSEMRRMKALADE